MTATNPQVDPVDQLLPARSMLTLGLQHVLIIYAGLIAVPLILGESLGLSTGEIVTLINCNLIIGGLATVVQTVGFWKFGARLPLIQGASFIALAPMLLIGGDYGLPYVYGSVIAAGLLTILIAPFFSMLLKFFPRVVIGCLITVVGISLMPAAVGWLGGGEGADDFGSLSNLLLGLVTVIVTVIIYVKFKGLTSSLAVLIGLFVGTAIAMIMGKTDFSAVADASWVAIAAPMEFGAPKFSLVPILVMTLAMIVIMAETTGNSLAIGRMINANISPNRLANTFRGEGLAAIISGLYNSFPLNAFSQNTGLIAMTKVRSRYVVTVAGIIMVSIGLMPKLAAIVAAIPPSVLGGSAIMMFGMTTSAGIAELARVKYEGTHNTVIVAISISIGVIPMANPAIFGQFDGPAKLILESGIFLCAISAVLLNALFNRGNEDTSRANADQPDPREEEKKLSSQDLDFLRESIKQSHISKNNGHHPFAALVVAEDGTIISSAGNNSMPPKGDPTQHAELRAAADAAKRVSQEELSKATLYTSAEPCAMCTGAVYWTGIGRIVYALSEENLLIQTGDDPENPTFALPCRDVVARGQRDIEVIGPALEEEAREPHVGFWKPTAQVEKVEEG